MVEYELTEKEVEIINKLRKKNKVNEERIKKKVDKFVSTSHKLCAIVEELYDLKETNDMAKKIIESQTDISFLTELYEVLKGDE